MTEKVDSMGRYFVAGLAIGWVIGILFSPKSGDGARDYLSQKINEGHKHARKKARELRERAEDLIERGKEMVNEKKDEIAEKLDDAVKAHLPEKSKAKGA
jgi:gas vesicle protein